MAIAQCVECDREITVEPRRVGVHVVCDFCGAEMEVVSTDPLELDLVEEGAGVGWGLSAQDDEDELDELDELDDEETDDDEFDDDFDELDEEDEFDDELDDDYDYDDDDDDYDFDEFDDDDDDRW